MIKLWNTIKSFGKKIVAWMKKDFAFIVTMF